MECRIGPDMEAGVKVSDSGDRGGGQALATVITLIFAGQPEGRGRMTVSRAPSWPRTRGVGRYHKGPTRILGDSVRPDRDRRCHHLRGHAALAASGRA